MWKGGSQYLNDLRSGKVDYLKLLTAFAGCRPNPIEVWWQGERDDSCLSNNPYIIARAYEGQRTAVQYPPIPDTPKLADAYENGILDGSFGQVISFASYYQTSFRIEVPLWHKVEDGVALLGKEQQGAAMSMLAKPVLPDDGPSPSRAVTP